MMGSSRTSIYVALDRTTYEYREMLRYLRQKNAPRIQIAYWEKRLREIGFALREFDCGARA